MSSQDNDNIRTSTVKVLAAPHTGITVPNLQQAIHLFHNILGLPIQRTNRLQPPISTITGHPNADINIAIVELPGGHLIELLEYSRPSAAEKSYYKPLPWEVGSWHLCLTVSNLEATVRALEDAKWEGESMGWRRMALPQRLTAGPNAGKKLCYLRDANGLVLELFEARN